MIFYRNKRVDGIERNLPDIILHMFRPDYFLCTTNREAILSLAATFDLISVETLALILNKNVDSVAESYNRYFKSAAKDGFLKRYSLRIPHNNVKYVYSITSKGLKFIDPISKIETGRDYKAPSYTEGSQFIRHDYIAGLCIAGLLSHNLKPAAVKMENKIIPEGESGLFSNRGITFADGSLSVGNLCTIYFEYDTGHESVGIEDTGRYKQYRNDLISKLGRYEANEFFHGADLLDKNTKILFCFEREGSDYDVISKSELKQIMVIWASLNRLHISTYRHFRKRIDNIIEFLLLNHHSLSEYESYTGKDKVMLDIKAILPFMKDALSIRENARKYRAKNMSYKTADTDRTFEEYGLEFMKKRLIKLCKSMQAFENVSSLTSSDDIPMPDDFMRFIKGRTYIKQVRFTRRRRNSLIDRLCRTLLSIDSDEMAANALSNILKGMEVYALPAPLVGDYSEYIVPNNRCISGMFSTAQFYSNAKYISARINYTIDEDKLLNAPSAFKGLIARNVLVERGNTDDEAVVSIYIENLSLDISGFVRAVACASYMTDADKDIHILYVEELDDARYFLEILKKYSVNGYERVIPPDVVLGGYNYKYPERIDLSKPRPFHYVFCRMPAAIPEQCISKETLDIPENHMFTFNNKGEVIVFKPGGKAEALPPYNIYTGKFPNESGYDYSAVMDPVGYDDE